MSAGSRPAVDVFPARVPWPAVVTFLVLALGMAWLVTLPLRFSEGLRSPLFTVLALVMMYTPLAAALIVTLAFQRLGLRGALRRLGAWPIRPVRRTLAFAGVAAGVAFGVVALGIAVSAALGLAHLDLVHFSGFRATLLALLHRPLPVPIQLLVAAQLLNLIIGTVVNCFATLGEELGWRGFLLGSLRPLGAWPAILITGAVWGLWHAPIILLGYDFGRPDLAGVALMVGACIAWGTVLGWLRLRSASVWPAVVGHAALNAVAGLLTVLAAARTTAEPALVGPLGVVVWVLLGALVLVLALTGNLREAPAPAAAR